MALLRSLPDKCEGRMFPEVSRTWNPVKGCRHGCSYCWARMYAARHEHLDRWSNPPWVNEREFNAKFRPGEIVFVCDNGDLMGRWVPKDLIEHVIEVVRRHPDTWFLFLTKNPGRYREFRWPPNVILGATIETDRDDLALSISRAPPPSERLRAMRELKHPLKMISVEPIMDFTPAFPELILGSGAIWVEVGYDNYPDKHPPLVEPPLAKARELIGHLRKAGIKVTEKTMRDHLAPHDERRVASLAAPTGALSQVSLGTLQSATRAILAGALIWGRYWLRSAMPGWLAEGDLEACLAQGSRAPSPLPCHFSTLSPAFFNICNIAD